MSKTFATAIATGVAGGLSCAVAVAALSVTVLGGAAQQAQAVDPPTAGVPVGTVVPYAGTDEPTGWLKANGQTFSAVTFPELNTLLGGTTTPDLRGQFLRGWSTTTAQDPAAPRDPLSTQADAFESHQHAGTGTGTDICNSFAQGAGCDSLTNQGGWRVGLTPSSSTMLFARSLFTGGDETRPVNTAVTYLIRATP